MSWEQCIPLLSLISGVSFLLSSIIYYMLPSMKDTQGKCIVHYSLCMGMMHLTLTSLSIVQPNSLPQHICLAHYLITIYFTSCGFVWMHILSYNMWKTAKNKTFITTNIRWYLLIGYGIPALELMVLYFTSKQYPHSCLEINLDVVYLLLLYPLMLLLLVSFFYFIDAQCRLIKLHSDTVRTATFKLIMYRCLLYLKLWTVMGAPWAIIIMMILFNPMMFFFGWPITIPLVLMIASEGITFFILMVLLRKKVLKGIANHSCFGFYICPSVCRSGTDFGTEEGDEDVNTDVHYDVENQSVKPDMSNQNVKAENVAAI